MDGRSLASVGKLDVLSPNQVEAQRDHITVDESSSEVLKKILKNFAERAFSSSLSDAEMAPYYQASVSALADGEDFVEASKHGLKAILCSHRFLMSPVSTPISPMSWRLLWPGSFGSLYRMIIY